MNPLWIDVEDFEFVFRAGQEQNPCLRICALENRGVVLFQGDQICG
jgi:hypothetical protein